MTSEVKTPTPLTSVGIAQALVEPDDTEQFYSAGQNREFIVLASSSGTVTATVTCMAPCNMPDACNVSGGTDDAGMHPFVMSVSSGSSPKTFVIPYIDHYQDPNNSNIITITFSNKANTTFGIFKMPAE